MLTITATNFRLKKNLHTYCIISARNNVRQSDNFQTILYISGQFNYCPDIVSEQLTVLESNLTKSMAFHYEVC